MASGHLLSASVKLINTSTMEYGHGIQWNVCCCLGLGIDAWESRMWQLARPSGVTTSAFSDFRQELDNECRVPFIFLTQNKI
jgi:hypothetical protein